jgi:NAD(P)-dependent dehydrogenase (short-subunit alcohol dehydrogenase family)
MQRTWLITGISSGFGRIMAEQLLANGDRVAGTVRDLSTVSDLTQRYPQQLWLAKLELSDIPSIRGVIDEAFGALGKIDVVVNNAGYGLFGAAEEATDEQMMHQINTNLIGSIQVIRAALPHLRQAEGGRIIQLSTVGGQAVFPGGSFYHAAKWGIEGFIDALRLEVSVFNIGCTLIEPGSARTNFRYGSSRLTPQNLAYDASPASMARKMINARAAVPLGDPLKMVQIMIESVNVEPAPRRIALGSDCYTVMHQQISSRLQDLEAQKEIAFSTDIP